jgi:predicted aspartyl protease
MRSEKLIPMNIVLDTMNTIRCCLVTLCALIVCVASACTNFTIVDNAIKKQGAALYYYKQRDYTNAKLNCKAALMLWNEIKQTKTVSYPDWSADNHIETCQEILEDLPISEMSEEATVVPIRVRRNQVFVTAVLNDKKSANLLLDTGATITMLSPEMAEKVGIAPELDAEKWTVSLLGDKQVEMPFVKLPEIRVGDATVKNLSVGVFTVDPDRPGINGILGEDFLSHYVVSIDHKSEQLKLISK